MRVVHRSNHKPHEEPPAPTEDDVTAGEETFALRTTCSRLEAVDSSSYPASAYEQQIKLTVSN